MISKNQRIHLFAELWRDACKVQGWKQSDREFRLAKLSEILGREITSTNDISHTSEFDRVKKELLHLADKISIKDDEKARLLKVIELQKKFIGIYRRNADGYVQKILAERHKIFRGISVVEDLSAEPRHVVNARGELEEKPSQMMMLIFTLTARVNSLRNEAGDTIHEMKMKAGVPCDCTICVPRGLGRVSVNALKTIADSEIPEDAELAEATENQPF